ncbi:MAG: DUF3037 domain-containing protein [Candidatus Sulfotelmatobacter sp.]
MSELKQLRFFLLRYVPDAVKGEFVNIGVIAKEIGTNTTGFAGVRFTRDWRRVRGIDPQVDMDVLNEFEEEIRAEVAEKHDPETLVHRLQESFSNVVQLSAPQECLTENPAKELEAIAEMYLEVLKGEKDKTISGRQEIVRAMRDAFIGAGLRGFVIERLPLSSYTKPGDPLKYLDFAYKAKKEMKVFQAVSLKAGVGDAVTLAARYPKIEPLMARNVEAVLSLTAVVDDDLDRKRNDVQFALNMMEEEKFTIAVAAEMPMIAEVARRELRV